MAIFCCSNKGKGTEFNPITIYFMPAIDTNVIMKNSLKLTEFLRKTTGYYFMPVIPVSYSDVINSFAENKADAALMASTAYVISNEKFGVVPTLKFLRDGKSAYRGQIIVLKRSKIKTLEHINDKTVAYTDELSTTGYLLPNLLFKMSRVIPKSEVFSSNHYNSIEMLLSSKVDVACTFEGAHLRMKNKYPDIEKQVKIIQYTEYISNDVLCFRKNFNSEMKSKVIAALLEYMHSENGKAVMKELLGIDGFTIAKDEDYDLIREALKATGKNIEDFM